jgi:hypothetical protein
MILSWFQTFAVFCILCVFFWVFPRGQIVICRRFGTFCQFHFQYSTPSLWRWNWQKVPKRRQITIWRRGNTQKNTHNIMIQFLNTFRSIVMNFYQDVHLEKYTSLHSTFPSFDLVFWHWIESSRSVNPKKAAVYQSSFSFFITAFFYPSPKRQFYFAPYLLADKPVLPDSHNKPKTYNLRPQVAKIYSNRYCTKTNNFTKLLTKTSSLLLKEN